MVPSRVSSWSLCTRHGSIRTFAPWLRDRRSWYLLLTPRSDATATAGRAASDHAWLVAPRSWYVTTRVPRRWSDHGQHPTIGQGITHQTRDPRSPGTGPRALQTRPMQPPSPPSPTSLLWCDRGIERTPDDCRPEWGLWSGCEGDEDARRTDGSIAYPRDLGHRRQADHRFLPLQRHPQPLRGGRVLLFSSEGMNHCVMTATVAPAGH